MIQIKVLSINEQKNQRGTTLLSIIAQSGGKKYTFVVKKVQYMDKKKRKSLQQLWVKEIKEDRKESHMNTKAKKDEERELSRLATEEFELEEDDE